jgi:Na+-driven multidrug efflux pump
MEAALVVSWLVLFVRPASSGSSVLNIITSLLQCFCLFSVLLAPIMIGSVTLPGAAENLSLLRSSFVALWAVANLAIALLVKIQLSNEKASKKFSRADWSWLPTQVLFHCICSLS